MRTTTKLYCHLLYVMINSYEDHQEPLMSTVIYNDKFIYRPPRTSFFSCERWSICLLSTCNTTWHPSWDNPTGNTRRWKKKMCQRDRLGWRKCARGNRWGWKKKMSQRFDRILLKSGHDAAFYIGAYCFRWWAVACCDCLCFHYYTPTTNDGGNLMRRDDDLMWLACSPDPAPCDVFLWSHRKLRSTQIDRKLTELTAATSEQIFGDNANIYHHIEIKLLNPPALVYCIW